MISKNRYVLGCYPTVDEVIEIIRQLKAEGYTNDEICLVTRENYVPVYAQKTDIQIMTEEEVLAQPPRNPQEEEMWAKINEAFAIVKRPRPRHVEPDYSTDDDPLYAYQDNLDQGCIVIMVDKKKATQITEQKDAAQKEPQQQEARAEEADPQAILDATDSLRSNVMTSTSKESVLDAGLAQEEQEDYLHDNESHTEGV